MSQQVLDVHATGKLLHVSARGKLTKETYQEFVPLIEHQIEENGKLKILLELHDFHGWTAGALWEDTKFGAKHFNDVERLAIVGETKWEKGMSVFCKPFTTGKIKYFDVSEKEQAIAWLNEG